MDLRPGRRLFLLAAGFLLLCGAAEAVELRTEASAYAAPRYDKRDLLPILSKKNYNEEDYRVLLCQTGLGRPAVDALRGELSPERYVQRMLAFQENYYAAPEYVCERRVLFTKHEFFIDEEGRYTRGFEFASLKNGDILITLSSHTFGWRNGHAGIVTDASAGQTVEAVSPGMLSALQSIEGWRKSPTILVLRLKESAGSSEAAEGAARFARESLVGIPYRLTAGLTSPKEPSSDRISGTQCAHLIWLAYRSQGIDLDSDGGCIVTVADLIHSPLLETVQLFGINPEESAAPPAPERAVSAAR